MGTIANAKVTHYYNCYNGDFIGCLLLKALDLLKKRPVTNDRKNIKTGCTNHLIQPVFIFIRLYTTD